ncbi:MAG: hypothetical protein IJ677_06925, partial [Alphaproteobacteria bacterium]|nr:hypothetical protein [Alphaproteobacteria bacterium]
AANEQELAKTLEKHNLQLYHYPPDTQEFTLTQSAVARMAFTGTLPPLEALSPSDDIIKGKSEYKGIIKPEDYIFEGSKWEVFKQIPEFAELEDKLREGLAKKGIPPEELPKLRVHDYCYILDQALRKYPEQKYVKFMKESHKARNTKRFISENEEEFRAGLLAMPGIRKDYVEALVDAMKIGITDVKKYKKNGQSVWKEEWANQPVINVHHIVNVKDADTMKLQGKKWYNVNDYENMCFIVTYPQHEAMHALEKIGFKTKSFKEFKESKKKDRYRIQPPEGVRCMLGFHNMIYDRKHLGLPEKEEIKKRAENNPYRRSGNGGQSYSNDAKNPYKLRQDWKNRGRYDARYGEN